MYTVLSRNNNNKNNFYLFNLLLVACGSFSASVVMFYKKLI